MIRVEYLENNEFEITWKAIDIGFRGEGIFVNQLSVRNIIDYALLQMEQGNEDEVLTELACEYDTNFEEVDRLVKVLANNEGTSYNIEFRKWRVLYVRRSLPMDKTEYVKGLIELRDIWVELDFPEDSSHVFQGKENDVAPEQYYSKENYLSLLQKHREWIQREISELKNM